LEYCLLMRSCTWALIAIACSAPLIAAEKIDPRLATMRKAWVEPVDELGDDRLVAACLADRLDTLTPMARVATKEEADVVLRVKAHLTSGAWRVVLGSMGGTPSAHLEATLPDGTTLWADGAKYRRGTGVIGLAADPGCGLANGLLDALRKAMEKARDKK
jgi:hypothetical protein